MNAAIRYFATLLMALNFAACSPGEQANESNLVGVNYENFPHVETDMQISRMVAISGGTNQWMHLKEPTPIDKQNVIRMNRDTLYSFALVDVSEGATITLPDAGDRYMSLMVINNDGYVNQVLHGSGKHALTLSDSGTPFVVILVRTLVDSDDPQDVAAVNALQEDMVIDSGQSAPFIMPNYNQMEYQTAHDSLIELARQVPDSHGMFGKKEDVDPIRFVIGSAMGWGGLPGQEAEYKNVEPGLPVGEYEITVRDVPVDGFWSISLYNKDGYFEKNDLDAYSVNNITGTQNPDGSFTVHFGGCEDERINCLPISEGWNYVVRLYRPQEAIRDGTWTFPDVQAVKQ